MLTTLIALQAPKREHGVPLGGQNEQPDESTPTLHLAKGESEARIQGEPGTADQKLASKAGTPCVAVGGVEYRDDHIGECFKSLQLGPLFMSIPSLRQQGRRN